MGVGKLTVLAGAIYAGYTLGMAVGQNVAAPLVGGPPWLVHAIGAAVVALPIIWTGKALAWLFRQDLAGNTSVLIRRPVGYLLRTALLSLPVALSWVAWHAAPLFLRAGDLAFFLELTDALKRTGGWVIYAGALGFLWTVLVNPEMKHRVGRVVAPFRRMLRGYVAGKGGSSTFAGLFEEWAHPFKRGGIQLGRSIYDPSWTVGLSDDRHAATFASNGAGKGRTAIIPNLLRYPYSVLVIDPKGTNAAVTGRARGKGWGFFRRGLGQSVYVLNPFRVNEHLKSMPRGSRFNPLSILDPSSSSFYEDLDLLADALVVPSGGADNFFDNSARGLLRALMGFAVIKYGKKATLMTMRELLAQIMDTGNAVIREMLECGGVIADAASQIANAEDRVKSSILVTAIQHTDWLGSEAMQYALSASDFDILELKDKPTSVYLVLPPEYLATHGRFLRLFVNLAVKASSMGGRSKTPILFLLDEFYSLGPLKSLSMAISNIRSYNVKVWVMLQNLSQLIELYRDNWETFIANAAFIQFFSINDATTAAYVAGRLGRKVIYQEDQAGNFVPAGVVDLRDQVEVTLEVSRISGRQIIFREGEDPMVLDRMNYDEEFSPMQYDPDPDHM